MRFLPPPLAAVLVVLGLTVAGCSSDQPPAEEAAPDAPEEPAQAEGEDDAEEGAAAEFPTEPIDVDGLGPCDLLSGDAAGRLGLPETGTADENAVEGLTACDWEDLAAGIYIGIILDTGEFAYPGFELVAEEENTLVDVEGYPALEVEEFGQCVVQLALSPDAVVSLSGFQNGGSGADCEYLWEAAEEVVATLA